MNPVYQLLIEVLLFLPLAGLVASIFLWQVYLSDPIRPRSWVLFMLSSSATVVTFVSLAISVLAVIRLGGTSIGETGGMVLVVVLIVLEGLPVWYAISIWRRRRTARLNGHAEDTIGTSSDTV